MISIEDARQIIAERILPLLAVPMKLAAMTGGVLREDVVASEPFPPADCSMMDGYAIAAEDNSEGFQIVAELAAGGIPKQALQRGECARIFTGAMMPKGATEVIPQEDADVAGTTMKPLRRGAKRWVRVRGEEAMPGAVLLRAGALLGGAELAILAQVGCVKPLASPVPRIAHVVTGDELVDPADKPPRGKIRDSNSSQLRGLLAANGTPAFTAVRCGDDGAKLVKTCGPLMDPARFQGDLLLISGGASVGDYDFGARALREMGFEIHFERVNLRPGKPLIFATRGAQAAFVIPGNPVSHFVCFHVAIRLAIERLRGLAPAWAFIDMELGGGDTLRGDPRETFWPAKVVVCDGRLVVTPRRWSSSGDTFALAGANALIRLAPACAAVEPGGRVNVLLLDVPRAG